MASEVSYTHQTVRVRPDVRASCPQVRIIGEPDAKIQKATAAAVEPIILIRVAHGAPIVNITNVRFLGPLEVRGGTLTLSHCTVEEESSVARQRAMSIIGGDVTLAQTTLRGRSMGAISVDAARLALVKCVIQDSRAVTGGAMLIRNDANVTIEASNLTDNHADFSGGALQVKPTNLL